MAVTPHQVKVYRSARNTGYTQVTAAAKAAISERTGRRIDTGQRPARRQRLRHWRTRQDPFDGVWDTALKPLLEAHPHWQAITLLEELQACYPGQYPDHLLRTLQRRVKAWRALHGPAKEVMFRQTHFPGRLGLSDFTVLKDIVITVGGKPLVHRLYHFRLAYSGWCDVKVILGGESYTGLAEGLTRALSRLGGAPAEHRSDSLSAAFKNLSHEAQQDLPRRYQALCWNSGMEASRNQPGVAHENGAIESPHAPLKRRIERTLLRRGTAEFASLADYQAWLDAVTAAIHQRNQSRIEEERSHLLPLPAMPAVDYTELFVRVTSTSTINVRLVVYSVPSRLIGERLRVHLYDDRLLCYVGTTLALELPRLYPIRGKRRARCIDYRHLIDDLVKKPMAFYHSQLRDDLLPSETYHRIWRALKERLDARSACKLMVGCLHLAAHYDCEQALGEYVWQALATPGLPRLGALQQRFGRPVQGIPVQALQQHPLADYDSLLECFGAEVAHA